MIFVVNNLCFLFAGFGLIESFVECISPLLIKSFAHEDCNHIIKLQYVIQVAFKVSEEQASGIISSFSVLAFYFFNSWFLLCLCCVYLVVLVACTSRILM